MIECVYNYTSTYARKQGYNWTKKKHWYEYVPKSVETSQADKVGILWNQLAQYKLTEVSPTTNQTL